MGGHCCPRCWGEGGSNSRAGCWSLSLSNCSHCRSAAATAVHWLVAEPADCSGKYQLSAVVVAVVVEHAAVAVVLVLFVASFDCWCQ